LVSPLLSAVRVLDLDVLLGAEAALEPMRTSP
jgi:hypothetical protein